MESLKSGKLSGYSLFAIVPIQEGQSEPQDEKGAEGNRPMRD